MSEQESIIPLEQVAAVFAAEQEGFAIDEVLAIEGIEQPAWESARADALLSVATNREQHARYAQALREAQDRLHCDVTPVFDDVADWVAFVHATEKQPFPVLAATHALVPNDLCRLERHWRERLDSDRALSERARTLRNDPPALPALVVGERKLVPSPYAKKTQEEAANQAAEQLAQADAGDGYDELHRMSTLYAVLRSNVSLEAAHTEFGFADVEEAKEAIRIWDLQTKYSPQLAADFRALVAHYGKRRQLLLSADPNAAQVLAAPVVASVAAPPTALPDPEQGIDETAMLDPNFLPLEALPFADPTLVPDTADTTAFLTAIVFDGPDHPFDAPEIGHARGDVDATRPVNPALRFSAPTPFDEDSEPAASAPDSSPQSADAHAASDIDSTGMIEAIRFETLPFGSGRADSDEKSVGGLTVEQYASYCAELALYPARKRQIGARYHIEGEHEHAKVNLKWNNAIAASPETRARFQEVFAAYRAHLRNHPLKW